MKMPTLVGIFMFMSRENLMLSWVAHEESFITLEHVSDDIGQIVNSQTVSQKSSQTADI